MKEIQEIKVGLKLKQKKDNLLPGVNGINGVTPDSIFEVEKIENGNIIIRVGLHLGVFEEDEVRIFFNEIEETQKRKEVLIDVLGKTQKVNVFINEPKRTVAAFMDYDGVRIRGIAKCMKEDKFSAKIGQEIAIDRILVKLYSMYKEKVIKECDDAIIQCTHEIAKY